MEGTIDAQLSDDIPGTAAEETALGGGVLTADDAALGERAARTRTAILEATRKLFLDKGYAGTRINNITDACGISRAGFYTYFRDKREVFTVLGEQTFRDILLVVGELERLPQPCGVAEVSAWVRQYFDFMDVHGAFIFSSAQSAPDDEEFRNSTARLQMRVAWMIGMSLRGRQVVPTDAPEALGLTVNAMLDRAWYFCRGQRLPVDENDMVRTLATTILGTLTSTTTD
ncbi:TetR/AcrR family transcriptional regulator [Cryptosporangium aurantiacum]|uniref:Transcriptional regulator, TetR family n=1 Tax=Cryptosporangium aurantiacum TaxID=134849 RepID=A0A1M7PNJ9_9ACTN|nr:TetR/AcrR family transcriptional regulator [Cryptosporangium aurantiacum]SHN18841.1 transcriptional regulator, TetR family [Cryptosporangium aurantiacum]